MSSLLSSKNFRLLKPKLNFLKFSQKLLLYQCKQPRNNIVLKRKQSTLQNSYLYYNTLFNKLRTKPQNAYPVLKSFCSSIPYEHESVQPETEKPHIPVLAAEVLDALNIKENGVYLDMTFGAGGHTQAILESHPNVAVYGLDRDPESKTFADSLSKLYPGRFHSLLGKFSDLPELLFERGVGGNVFNGVLMDLGASSMQFNTPRRGFMVSQDGPLDMRMGDVSDNQTPTAAQILAHIDEESLYRVLKYYGQEKSARALSRVLIESRSFFQINTTKELAQLVESAIGVGQRMDKLQRFSHPATKTFQALRILVNDELNQLDYGIRLAHFYLQSDGILAAISFHSLEDAILKRHIMGCDLDKTSDSIGMGLRKHRGNHLSTYNLEEIENEILKPWSSVVKHVIVPSEEEVSRNPRARSAKLRVASKIDCPPY